MLDVVIAIYTYYILAPL